MKVMPTTVIMTTAENIVIETAVMRIREREKIIRGRVAAMDDRERESLIGE